MSRRKAIACWVAAAALVAAYAIVWLGRGHEGREERPVPSAPKGPAVDAWARHLDALRREGKGSVSVANRPASIRTVQVETPMLRVPGSPEMILPWGDRVLVSLFGKEGGVAIVDPRERRIEGYIPVDPSFCLDPMAVAGGKLFVGQVFSEFTLVYDLRTRSLLAKIPVGGEGALAASPDGRRVFLGSNKEHAFTIIDAATFEFRKVAYPPASPRFPGETGRGCLAAAVAPDGALLYLGIQRPTPFVAVYDLRQDRYAEAIYLDEFQAPKAQDSESGIIYDIAFSPSGRVLFLGMFQSAFGVFAIDRSAHQVATSISFDSRNEHFVWPDSMGMAFYGDRLVVVNRNRDELAVLSPGPEVAALSVPLPAGSDVTRLAVLGHTAIVGGRNALYFVDLREVLRRGKPT